MKTALLAAFLIQAANGQTDPVFYQAVDVQTGDTLWEFSVAWATAPDGWPAVSWRSESGDGHRQQYRLDERHATLEWRIQFPERDTDYVGERREASLLVRGRLNGQAVDATLPIDDRPFFYSLPVGLAEFVRSGAPSMEFWAFRPDDVAVYAMDARVEGRDTVTVGGEPVEAVRVRWAPTGWRGWFYSRRFWFRADDGLFLRTDARDGYVTELRPP